MTDSGFAIEENPPTPYDTLTVPPFALVGEENVTVLIAPAGVADHA
jgi:hypothetical protein